MLEGMLKMFFSSRHKQKKLEDAKSQFSWEETASPFLKAPQDDVNVLVEGY